MHVSTRVFITCDVNRNIHLWSPSKKYNIIYACKSNMHTMRTLHEQTYGLLRPRTHIPKCIVCKNPAKWRDFFILLIDSFHSTKNLFVVATGAPGHLFCYQSAPAPHLARVPQMAHDYQTLGFSFYCRNIST